MDVLYAFRDVVVQFEDRTALAGVTVDIVDDGVTVVLGPSGSGKSTLLRLCNRLDVPTSGEVRFRGDDVAGMDPLVLRRRVGMVFQRPTVFPGTVRDNLLVAEPSADDAAMVRALGRAALPAPYLERVGDQLSGGEAQRACLARTLITEPEVLLMDEPTSALDPAATRQLEELACGVAGDGIPVIWVTHDLDQAARIADHRIVLHEGRLATSHEIEHFSRLEDPNHEHEEGRT
jgi:putative ABC transport system ATP-binding protein